MTKKRREAVLDEVASELWRVKSNGISGSGLGSESFHDRVASFERMKSNTTLPTPIPNLHFVTRESYR